MASYIRTLFGGDDKEWSFRWRVNRHREIVIEIGDEFVALPSTYELQDSLNSSLKKADRHLVVCSTVGPWYFGCDTWEKVAQRLNSKSSNKAKTALRFLLSELWARVPIAWDKDAKVYKVKK